MSSRAKSCTICGAAAFLPGCSQIHLPSYIDAYDEIMAAGFDDIACIAVRDMGRVRATSLDGGDKITMLADGSATYVRTLGSISLPLTVWGFAVSAFQWWWSQTHRKSEYR